MQDQDEVSAAPRNIYTDATIVIVDDEVANIRLLQSILKREGYKNVVATSDSREVTDICSKVQPDLILLDLMMPYLDGFQILQQLSETKPGELYLPILVLTADITPKAKRQALTLGAKDFLTKPLDNTEVLLRIKNLLETRFLYIQLQGQNQHLDEKVRERTHELEQAQFEILERLTVASEYRDDDTGQHTRRVGYLSALLARSYGLTEHEIQLIERVAPLHDVGKIGISDEILLKPARLTPYEFEVMKTHTLIGARILSGGESELVRAARTIALTHHERWDGTGYPLKLKAESIPEIGRIVALADTFDALTHRRPYKEAWSFSKAKAEIEIQSGKQFDPYLVEVFLRIDDEALLPPPATLPKLPALDIASLEDFLIQPFWKSATEPLSMADRHTTQKLSAELSQ